MTAGSNEEARWIHDNFQTEKYLGHKIRVTAMIKTADVTRPSGITARVFGKGFHKLAGAPADSAAWNYNNQEMLRILGTNDWKKYEVIVNVPKSAEIISVGAVLNGGGTLWIDDVHYEIVP
jgi:hypothetical protein